MTGPGFRVVASGTRYVRPAQVSDVHLGRTVKIWVVGNHDGGPLGPFTLRGMGQAGISVPTLWKASDAFHLASTSSTSAGNGAEAPTSAGGGGGNGDDDSGNGGTLVFRRGGSLEDFARCQPIFETAVAMLDESLAQVFPLAHDHRKAYSDLWHRLTEQGQPLLLRVQRINKSSADLTISIPLHPVVPTRTISVEPDKALCIDLILREDVADTIIEALDPPHIIYLLWAAQHSGPGQDVSLQLEDLQHPSARRGVKARQLYTYLISNLEASTKKGTPLQQAAYRLLTKRRLPDGATEYLREAGYPVADIRRITELAARQPVWFRVVAGTDYTAGTPPPHTVRIEQIEGYRPTGKAALKIRVAMARTTAEEMSEREAALIMGRALLLASAGFTRSGVSSHWPEAIINLRDSAASGPESILTLEKERGKELLHRISSALGNSTSPDEGVKVEGVAVGSWRKAWVDTVTSELELMLRRGRGDNGIPDAMLSPRARPYLEPLINIDNIGGFVIHGRGSGGTVQEETHQVKKEIRYEKTVHLHVRNTSQTLLDLLEPLTTGTEEIVIRPKMPSKNDRDMFLKKSAPIPLLPPPTVAFLRLAQQYKSTLPPGKGVRVSGGEGTEAMQEALGTVIATLHARARQTGTAEARRFMAWLKSKRRIMIEAVKRTEWYALKKPDQAVITTFSAPGALLVLVDADRPPSPKEWEYLVAGAYLLRDEPFKVLMDRHPQVETAYSVTGQVAESLAELKEGVLKSDFGASHFDAWRTRTDPEQRASFRAALRWFLVHQGEIPVPLRPLPTDNVDALNSKRRAFATQFHPDQGGRDNPASFVFGNGWEQWETVMAFVKQKGT